MKKLLKFARLAIVAIAWASAAQPSFAQCAGACASELTQLLNLARLVDQLATQGNILTTGTNQLHLATVNTTPLSLPIDEQQCVWPAILQFNVVKRQHDLLCRPEPHQLVHLAK